MSSPASNEINIDLSAWMGHPCTLQVFDHDGFGWRITGDSPAEDSDPLDDPGILFTTLRTLPDTENWFASRFPHSFKRLTQLEPLYAGRQWTALWLLEHYPVTQDLIGHHPLLPWLLIERARQGEMRIEELAQVLALEPLALLARCGLPGDPGLLALLRALPHEQLSPGIVQIISSEVVIANAASLANHEHLDIRLLKGLILYPWLADSALLVSYRSDWNWSNLRYYVEQIRLAATTLRLGSAEQLIRDSESLPAVRELCSSLRQRVPKKTIGTEEQMKIANAVLSALNSPAPEQRSESG